MNDGDERFLEVLARYSEGTLPANELVVLECELATSPEKRKIFREFMTNEQVFYNTLTRENIAEGIIRSAASHKRRMYARKALAVAALILLSLCTVWYVGNDAELEVQHLAIDNNSAVTDFSAEDLAGTSYQMAAGKARVNYDSATVVLAGENEFEVQENGIALVRGNVVAHSTGGSEFGVHVAEHQITSERGVFSVNTAADDTLEVFAFHGEVGLVGKLMMPVSLRAGEMAKIHDGEVLVQEFTQEFFRPFAQQVALASGVESLSGTQMACSRDGLTNVSLLYEGHMLEGENVIAGLIGAGNLEAGNQIEFTIPENAQAYLLEAPKALKGEIRRGSITFSNPIVAVINTAKGLQNTDSIVEFQPKKRGGSARGTLEHRKLARANEESVRVSSDGRTLYFQLNVVNFQDQLRVVVAKS